MCFKSSSEPTVSEPNESVEKALTAIKAIVALIPVEDRSILADELTTYAADLTVDYGELVN